MAITPDTKDWTWVLLRPCPDCGLDTSTVHRDELAARLRDVAARWPAVLTRPDARERPDPATWSALEYGCHVRDAFGVFEERVRQMLETDDPLFANWDQDATARERRYAEQDPATVAAEVVRAGGRTADRFAAVSGDQWQRPGRRSDGAAFTVESLGRYLLHDPVHHLHDVGA